MSTEQVLELAKDIAREYEGLELEVYLCPAGFPTIGYGHRCDSDHPPITKEQAETYLRDDMLDAYYSAVRYCKQVAVADDGKKAAITDFVFNLGAGNWQASTFRRRVEQGDWKEAAKECKRWVHSKGKKLNGLVARRELEVKYMERGY